MAKSRKVNKPVKKKPIEQYEHKDKLRTNNPPVGLVTPDTDNDEKKKTYAYDPHLDPQLVWAGKAEHTSFDIDTVSLHVHERIDPRSIIEAVRKKNGSNYEQMSLFSSVDENPPLRDAVDFYKHKHNWSNRLIAGDSLLVMNSLIEKEGLAGQVQMIYFDPPYGIKYGSNFQPFVNKRDVKDGKDEDLNQEPEMIKAFRDTWELGIHSYLSYLRDRLLLARELLHESGSVFVQISDENVHLVRNLMEEVFGKQNYISMIAVKRPTMAKNIIRNSFIYIIWFAKNKEMIKSRKLFFERKQDELPGYEKKSLGMENKITKEIKDVTIDIRNNINKYLNEWRFFQLDNLIAMGNSEDRIFGYEFSDKVYVPGSNGWKVSKDGLDKLKINGRLEARGGRLCYKNYFDDYPVVELTNLWEDTAGPNKEVIYVVQTKDIIIQRCLLMTTDPGDLVFDPTCGSGTSAYVAEQWGRRWITCDTSRVAVTLAKQRFMTSLFDYYELAYPEQGIGSGFKYKTVPHITLGSIANNEPPATETLYDQPFVDNSKTRVTGPFTVEAVPSQAVKPIDVADAFNASPHEADSSIARKGETLRQAEWRDELLKTGIRGKAGQYITFSRIEPLPGTRWLHADGETIANDKGSDKIKEPEVEYVSQNPKRVVISFGPEHSPLEQRQVALAIEEAQTLVPKPKLVIFAAFQFDPEAAKDIDELNWPGVTILKAQMNTDLLTDDLKKKRSSNESYWLIGQPDITVGRLDKSSQQAGKGKKQNGDTVPKYRVEVHGFDYFNTKTGSLESGGKKNIAMWMLDTDYDGRSLFPRQVFFPMAGEKDGWSRLAKNLKAEIDEELIEAYKGTISLPFIAGSYKRIAVKIVDDRGIESLRIITM